MNILVVDDDPVLADSICKALKRDVRIVLLHQAHSYHMAMKLFNEHHYNIIVLDIELCDEEDGLTLCQYFRKQNPKAIIVIITGYDSPEHLKHSFEVGANDYIRKVNLRNELKLRLDNWWAYVSAGSQKSKTIEYRGLSYNFDKNEYYFEGEKVKLSKGLKRLLLLFLKQPETVISHGTIQRELWGDHECSLKIRNIHERVRVLNQKFPYKYSSRIKNIFGEGYVLKLKNG